MTDLADRILDTFPSGSYALSALLRLMDIVESERVPTAAVECRVQPRLLINPKFVGRHAETPEKLLMLVMHELHHVLLGHTTLFPTVTPVQNFVFDCVINALISRMFPQPEHVSFLTDYYSGGRFPECLLRPPTGWSNQDRFRLLEGIRRLGEPVRKLVEEVYRSLYSESGATYKEIHDVLPTYVGDNAIASVPLLGGHQPKGSTEGELEHRSPILFDVVRGIVEQWPQPPDPIRGRSLSDILNEASVATRRVPGNRNILRALIRKIGRSKIAGNVRGPGMDRMAVDTPIPLFDRRSAVLRTLGVQPLLHPGSIPIRRRVPSGEKVHVYVDVSGSMNGIKDALYGAVLDCREWVHPKVHLFSTKIADVNLDEVRKGIVRSTGGTDICCVARHMAKNSVKRACLVTDGWVGRPKGRHFGTMSKAKLAIAYAGKNVNTLDLARVANHVANFRIGE
jgi:hypothetical protein